MDLETEFHFRNDNLQSKCFSFFKDIKHKKEFCDVTFRIGRGSISAHRIVISASIPYFRKAFFSATKDNTEENADLSIIDPNTFENLIEYAYSSEVKISERNVRDLLSGSCHLGVEEVQEACCEFLTDRLQPENVISIRDLACRLQCRNLLENTDCYIKEHFDLVSQTKDFLNLPFSYVEEIISKDDLLVSQEEEVFEAVMKWIKVSPQERKTKLPELLRKIRLPLLNQRYLTDNVATEELIRRSNLCTELVEEAKSYHWIPEMRQKTKNFSDNPRQFVPQLTDVNVENEKTRIYRLFGSTTYSAEYFEDKAKKWQATTKVAIDMNGCSFASLNEAIYFFHSDKSLQYDVKKSEFRSLEEMNPPRCFAGAVSLKDKIIVCGGSFNNSALNIVDCFNPKTNEWTKLSPMRRHRAGISAVVLGDYIYVLGGTDYSSVHDTVERYDSRTGKWRIVSQMLTNRCIASAATINGKIYVCGGDASPTAGIVMCIATAEVYDPVQNKWQFISPMKTARCQIILLPYRRKLYALGGTDDQGHYLGTIEIYDPECDEWIFGPSDDGKDFLSCAVVI